MRPILVTNPVGDRTFREYAELQVDDGANTVEILESRLRTRYPQAAVHARELSGERMTMWYVYRDGYWTAS
jgi:hypothetical protein